MRLHELYPFYEERKARKRVGRGSGSGLGCTAGKGNKGQKSRSGASIPAGFEGGQMPLQRRLPKGGFKNPFRVEYAPVNIDRILESFPEAKQVSMDDLYAAGLARKGQPIKILARGALSRSMTIEAHRFSKRAADMIREAGGTPVSLEGAAGAADDK